MLEKITEGIEEVILETLSIDVDEIAGTVSVEAATVAELAAQWHAKSRCLAHLPKADKSAVLARSLDYTPDMIDGLAVHVYNDVQAQKGDERTSLVVVDLGDCRLLFKN